MTLKSHSGLCVVAQPSYFDYIAAYIIVETS